MISLQGYASNRRDEATNWEIAEGNHTGEVMIYRDDELGQLGQAINDLSVKIKEAQKEPKRNGKGWIVSFVIWVTGVIATDRRGRIVIINAAALDILNLRSERIVGTPLLDVARLDRTVTSQRIYSSLKKNGWLHLKKMAWKIPSFNVSSQSFNVNQDL